MSSVMFAKTDKERNNKMTTKIDWKKILTSKAFITHTSAGLIAFLITFTVGSRDKSETFADKQDSAVYVYSDTGTKRTLNRDYFDPSTFKTVDWTNMNNEEIAKLFGETAAKELAMDIDSINRGLATPGKLFGLDYNYCNKSVTEAIVDATRRLKFRENNFPARPFAKNKGRRDALYNGDCLLNYFASDSVPNTIIKNPTVADFERISAGSVVRFPGHTKMFIGIGFVDGSGKTFVPNAAGKPVIASGYNERFSYFNGGECTVVDIARVVEHKLVQTGRPR